MNQPNHHYDYNCSPACASRPPLAPRSHPVKCLKRITTKITHNWGRRRGWELQNKILILDWPVKITRRGEGKHVYKNHSQAQNDKCLKDLKKKKKNTTSQGAWVAQWVERPTSAQVMTSQFMSLNPAWDSADSSEPGTYLVRILSLPLPCLHSLSLSLSLSKINKH